MQHLKVIAKMVSPTNPTPGMNQILRDAQALFLKEASKESSLLSAETLEGKDRIIRETLRKLPEESATSAREIFEAFDSMPFPFRHSMVQILLLSEGTTIDRELACKAMNFQNNNTSKLTEAAVEHGASEDVIDLVEKEITDTLNSQKELFLENAHIILAAWDKIDPDHRTIISSSVSQSQTILLNEIINKIRERL